MSVVKVEELKVLVVDDQADTRSLLKEMMAGFGVTQIFEAKDGRQALEFIYTAFDLVDMVICDWNMPKMSGLDLLIKMQN